MFTLPKQLISYRQKWLEIFSESLNERNFNIDLNKFNSHPPTTDYVKTLLLNKFLPIIICPITIP